mmetsp:Transcript_15910/g.49337  ORF Transcript_15910/g.49337 Transcript_15910/m.49337 type:complete len:213 (+) Transcript_15910:56-694(+)
MRDGSGHLEADVACSEEFPLVAKESARVRGKGGSVGAKRGRTLTRGARFIRYLIQRGGKGGPQRGSGEINGSKQQARSHVFVSMALAGTARRVSYCGPRCICVTHSRIARAPRAHIISPPGLSSRALVSATNASASASSADNPDESSRATRDTATASSSKRLPRAALSPDVSDALSAAALFSVYIHSSSPSAISASSSCARTIEGASRLRLR